MTPVKKGRTKRRIFRVLGVLGILLAILAIAAYFLLKPAEVKVLVFSKTEGFRHESIELGIEAIKKLGEKNNFTVVATENAEDFNENNLKDFMVVVFLNTTADVLNPVQQSQMERFIQAGGGFVGIHAATDTEYGWPWYGKLVGAYFDNHPIDPSNVQEGELTIVNPNHQATDSLPSVWKTADEWYNFKSIDPANQVLMTLDESTYIGGTNGANHPISWFKEYDGGRSFYTGLGHTKEQFTDPLFLNHLLGGIKYAIGLGQPVDYSRAYAEMVPEENRFMKTMFTQNLNEPMELDFLTDHTIIFIERRGGVHIYDLEKGKDSVILMMDVYTGAEDGLLGLAVDPNYKKNNWVYLYYAENKGKDQNNLSRFKLKNEQLDLNSEKIVLQVATERHDGHSGGSLEFGPDGNLFLGVGDNTSPRGDGFAPIDNREGRTAYDAQRSSANTNDLRGKILRIKPEDDGTYSIPDGNLFPVGTPNTRPEIYVMGNRNPYRISVDSRTGFLYWGEIGPDANKDSLHVGPKGHDEINRAQKAGNFGWPHFVANNKAYHTRDFVANTTGALFDSLKPINDSPNNTGLRELPPSQPAMIYYPYATSEEFPALGTGGRSAMAGPFYYSEDFPDSGRNWPDYFDGKLLAYDWMRGWIFAVSFTENGEMDKMTQIVPNMKFHNTVDMVFGPDGALYILEYGSGWFSQNVDATLSRIDFIKGNRAPKAEIAADKTIGANPMTVSFAGRNSIDYDGDALTYKWTFGDTGEESSEINPVHTFSESGKYKVKLEVTDSEGQGATTETEIMVGNELPELSWEITGGNGSFYWPDAPVNIKYKVDVNDAEDGNLSNGSLDASRVTVSIDYLAEGSDKIMAAKDHADMADAAYASIGKTLMNGSDCIACHKEKGKSIGPAYIDIAERYASDSKAPEMLANKIINGGSGNWGEVAMAAHPGLSTTEAKQIAEYILSLAEGNALQKSKYPVAGTYTSDAHIKSKSHGTYVMTASYTDKGGGKIEGLNVQQTLLLRYPKVEAESFDEGSGSKMNLPAGTTPGQDEDMGIIIGQKDKFVIFKNFDLTGVKAVRGRFGVAPGILKGGTVELRLGSLDGELVATIVVEPGFAEFGIKEFETDLSKSVDSAQDLYVVFRNEDPDPATIVTIMDWLEFLNKPIK